MRLFSTRAFLYTFAIALSLSFAIALAIVATQGIIAASNVLLAVLASVGISAILAALIAGYRLPVRWATWAYRAVMRSLAKRAVRSSLSYAMMPIECSGILETDLGLAIRVQAGRLHAVAEGSRFNVHESTDDRLWGKVVAVEVRDNDCDCIPYDRLDEEFWMDLENKVRTDTSAPSNVHLVRDVLEPGAIDGIEELLDNWR